MTYTIKEIALAWLKFTQPKYLTNDTGFNYKTHPAYRVYEENNLEPIETDYSNWIPYLISEEWKND
jgi:hypothetical protein